MLAFFERSPIYAGVAVFCLSIAITSIFWAALPRQFSANESTDYKGFYKPVAENIAQGNGVTLDGTLPTKFPPGYPFVLAGIFKLCNWLHVSEDTGSMLVNLIGMALVSLLLFCLGNVMFGQAAGLLGAVLWMTYPFALWLTKQPNSEVPFMIFLYAGILFLNYLISRGVCGLGYFVCGMFFGIAMLIRPIAIGIGFPLAIFVWFTARKLRPQLRALSITVLLLGMVVPVLPWEIWVYSKTKTVIMLSTTGPTNMRDGLAGFAIDPPPHRTGGGVPEDVRLLMMDMWQRKDEMLSISGLASILWHEIRIHPVALIKLYLLKVARSWYGTDTGRSEKIILLVQLLYLCLTGWAIRTMWKHKQDRALMAGILVLVTYFWGMDVLVNSTLRYVLPVIGALLLLIGAALASRKNSKEKDLLTSRA